VLQLQLENQQLLAKQRQQAAAAASCPVCSLQLAPTTAAGLQDSQQLVALLASKLQRCKQKLTAKRQLCSSLKDTNSQLAGQLVQLKTANAGAHHCNSFISTLRSCCGFCTACCCLAL
jgi:hypothetical protein